MKKYIIPIILVFISGCGPEEMIQQPEKPVPVKVTKVAQKEMDFPVHATGKMTSNVESKLGFKIGGIIENIYVTEGQIVQKGQLLASLNLGEILANEKKARAGVEKSKRDLERAKKLYEDSVATLEQYQNAKTAYDVAVSNLEIVQFNKRYSTILAPTAGKILKTLAEENEVKGAGHPVIIFASLEEDWIINVSVADREIVKLQTGDSASINFDAYPDQKFAGKISQVSVFADPYTGTYPVEIRLDKNPARLVSGFIAKVDIFPSNSSVYLEIPVEAKYSGSEMQGLVFIVKNNRAFMKTVRIAKIKDKTLVLNPAKSDISEQDQLVTEGINYLKDSCLIKIKN